jgi:hypothetical protein
MINPCLFVFVLLRARATIGQTGAFFLDFWMGTHFDS